MSSKRKKGANSPKRSLYSLSESHQPTNFLYIADPKTIVLLLRAGDLRPSVQAMDNLHDIVVRSCLIGQQLVADGLVRDLLTLPRQSHPVFGAVMYKLLSKLYNLFPEARDDMRNSTDFLEAAMTDAMTANDTALRGYALGYVALLTKDLPELLEEFFNSFDANKIFNELLVDPDVDVQNNSLELLKNYLCNDRTKTTTMSLRDFSYKQICKQVACPYPDIQNKALDVISILISGEEEQRRWLQAEFVSSGGIDLLITILYVFQWRDIHAKCLKILRHFVQGIISIADFHSVDGIKRLIDYIAFIEDDELQELDVDVLSAMAEVAEGRLVLVQNNVVPVLCGLLRDRSEFTSGKALDCLRLASARPADVRYDPVPAVLQILHGPDNSSELRSRAADTLHALVRQVPMCVLTVACSTEVSRLVCLLRQQHRFSDKILATISVLLETRRSALINRPLMMELVNILHTFQEHEEHLAVCAAKILARTLTRKSGRDLFLEFHGVNDVMKILYKTQNAEILSTLGELLASAFENRDLTKAFLNCGISSWFHQTIDNWKDCETLHTALRALINSSLSIKLELVGRLEETDITSDGFYVVRRPLMEGNDLFVLSSRSTRRRRIFYLYLGSDESPPIDDSITMFELDDVEAENLRASYPGDCHQDNLVPNEFEFVLDTRLRKILEEVRAELSSNGVRREDLLSDRRQMEVAIGILSRAVAGAMSGKQYDDKCVEHTLEMHLQELFDELGTSIVPIGRLEIGLELERAVMFKVLADQVGLPSALVKGADTKGWVEVLLPESSETCLVDLVTRPGTLLPLSSEAAFQYSGFPRNTTRLAEESLVARTLEQPDGPCKTKPFLHVEIE